MRSTSLLSLVLLLLAASPASARLIPHWAYHDLFKKSDLIVLASALFTENADDPWPRDEEAPDFAALNTTFEVRHVLKGKLTRSKFQVLHFRYAKVPWEIFDGPLLVAFRGGPKGSTILGPGLHYMLF